MTPYEKLQPAAVWKLFAEINRVPRASGSESAVMAMLERRATERGLATKRDAAGNLLVSVPASRGCEKAPTVVLQGHVDMVCEKNASSKHDFSRDPIVPRVKGEWVVAEGTTLGADNAIGVSMALAAAEDAKAVHGPLEILLTVDEERGLSGATGLAPGFIGGKLLVNLDSEDDRALTIACAGLRESLLAVKAPRAAAGAGVNALSVFVTGLKGGHSGLEINRGRGNAVKILARALAAAADAAAPRLATIEGGNKRNAIAREARAVVLVESARTEALAEAARAAVERIRAEELAGLDDAVVVEIVPAETSTAWSAADSRRLLNLLLALPHGVVAMSQAVEGLVESSTNLAVVRTDGDTVRIGCTSRSSIAATLELLAQQHRSLAALASAEIQQLPGVPGWKPDRDSRLLAATAAAYRKVFGRAPEIRGIHAGLECGVFKEKQPDLDTISFGPDIEGAHSPDERVRVASVQRVWKLLLTLLADLAKRPAAKGAKPAKKVARAGKR